MIDDEFVPLLTMFSTEGPEISSGSIILSVTDSAAKLHKAGTVCKDIDLFDGTHMFVDMSRRRETRQEDQKEVGACVSE